MKALLLTAVLGLVAALSLALEHQDLSGTWYVKAMVTDKDLQKENKFQKVFPVRVTILDDRDMEVTITFMKEDKCHQKTILMQKTDEPGKYTGYEGRKFLQVQKLLGTDDFVFYCEDRSHGRLHRMAKIMGRSSVTADPRALEEFKKFVQRKGFPEGAIFMPTQTESCAPAQ
uniref:Lipocalin/cytosolic fatty-acid binding domain-containing protein n=1 Tax=Otolemur garnettii TaxID=30611 RepID=H0XVQ1_OTOGA